MTYLLQKKPWQSTLIYTWLEKLFKYKEPSKIFVMTVEIPMHPKWKLASTQCFTLGKTQFSCEQCGNALKKKLIIHQHTRTLTKKKQNTCPCVKSKILYLINFSQRG